MKFLQNISYSSLLQSRIACLTLLVATLFSCDSNSNSEENKGTDSLNDSKKLIIKNINDSFTEKGDLEMDWGYASIIYFNNKKFVFDLGSRSKVIAHNVSKMSETISDIDFAILSHRHSDHMGGMDYLLAENPDVKIYAPTENFGIYGSELPSTFYKKDSLAPKSMQYYNGHPHETLKFGKAWDDANIELITKTVEIDSNIHLIFLVSNLKGTLELSEISLAIETDQGMNLVIGCGHTGLENILNEAQKINPKINLITGGFHLLQKEDSELLEIAKMCKTKYGVKYMAPSHCTGERAMMIFKKVYEDNFIYAGLGEIISIEAS